MKKIAIFCALALLSYSDFTILADDDDDVKTTNTAVAQLEDDIKYHEEVVEDSQDSIEALDARITELKERLDSLNKVVKDVKGQISELEKTKKGFQNEIKAANKARQATFANRDNLVFDKRVQEVLMNPYNKLDVETALREAENMETKEVLEKMNLVRDYGKYTKELRDFMDKQRSNFANLKWATQGVGSDASKNFHKNLKKQSYYKVYEKGLKNAKNASIPYLDRVIEEILVLERQGFNSKYQYDKVVNMLYGVE
ncbi:MAG: hypothetical protein J6S96_03435 [Muribaculaceae bacterium]|nr:hypothetical protein [Muribaculaceae bacterium]